MSSHKPIIGIIYTGGTIGMVEDNISGALRPLDFTHISTHVPEIQRLNLQVISLPFSQTIDSTNMNISVWQELARCIEENYKQVDGFVVLHGSDTMSYSASALSFMLEGLQKPVIFTGSQLPIGMVRTDGKENFLTALEIAAFKNASGQAMVQEVCVYFEYQLYRGNRTKKYSAEHFKAFESPNYPVLAQAGVHISFDAHALSKVEGKQTFKVYTALSNQVAIMYLFPGMNEAYVSSYLHIQDLRALVVCSFGSGNFPDRKDLTQVLQTLIQKGVAVVNITQCNMGEVNPAKYATNTDLLNMGVWNGKDLTLEAAVTKLMFIMGQDLSFDQAKQLFEKTLRGEMLE